MTRLALLVALATVGCSATPADDTDVGGDAPQRCRVAADCEDGIACTIDTCAAGNVCEHQPLDALCEEGETCVVGRGCIAGYCATTADCDDGVDCTLDNCGVSYTCEHQPFDALCADLEVCDPVAGCVPVGECRTAADCADEVDCTVDECTVEYECAHTPNDGLCGTDERCDPERGCYAWSTCETAADCADLYNFCDGTPRCDPEFGCRPPTEPRVCDDGDECTTSTCDRTLEMCVHEYDCSIAACAAANPACLWNGCFTIEPRVAQRCALGHVNYDFGRVCFELRGPSLAVVPDPAGTLTDPLAMAPAPTTADFDAVLEISGGCIETYRLAGTMTDADQFEAVWTANYTDHDGVSCGLSGCRAQTIPVHGTRVP
ncbi:MAG: hypothetical protein JXB32_07855 [Deltaproteobacteria bacterium]|nr:hypothetical protein [Deltaproteobacteria bacterium]